MDDNSVRAPVGGGCCGFPKLKIVVMHFRTIRSPHCNEALWWMIIVLQPQWVVAAPTFPDKTARRMILPWRVTSQL